MFILVVSDDHHVNIVARLRESRDTRNIRNPHGNGAAIRRDEPGESRKSRICHDFLIRQDIALLNGHVRRLIDGVAHIDDGTTGDRILWHVHNLQHALRDDRALRDILLGHDDLRHGYGLLLVILLTARQ